MCLRWLMLVPTLLGFIGVAAWMYFVYEPLPDPELACHYGAYDLDDGRVVTISPSSGRQTLRMVYMNGLTEHLKLIVQDAQGAPNVFSRSIGWSDNASPGDQVSFGNCKDGAIELQLHGPEITTGRRRTFDVTDVQFESHGLNLSGRLVMPRLEGAIPVAVLVHGSERDSAVLFNRLQYLFPANGIGVFVYDKRGTGKSDGSYTQNFHLLSDDAAAALKKARETAGALASEVGFEGGSQAGWIIPLAAGKARADFALVAYGLAENPLAEDREEVFDDLRMAGYGDDVIAKAREITDVTGRVMASNFKGGFDELDAVRAQYGKEPWFAKIKGEFTGDFLNTSNWLIKLFGPWFDAGTSWTYDPLPALQAYQGPHLWILAGRDSSAPSANTLRILRGVQATHANLDIVMFPTADHGMTEFEVKNGKRVDTRFSAGYFQLLVDWILFKDAKVTVQGPIVYDGNAAAVPKSP